MGLLRLWLAVYVVMAHSPAAFFAKPTNGIIAVEAFFIISGFYMQLIIIGYAGGNRWIAKFYASRILRIFPLYLIVLLLSLLFTWLTGISPRHGFPSPMTLFSSGSPTALATYIFTSVFILGLDIVRFTFFDFHTGYFHFYSEIGAATMQGARFLLVPQAWSLAVELCFYAMAPFLLLRGTRAVAAWAALSLAVKIILWKCGYDKGPWINGFFPSELGLFLCGALAYRAYAHFLAARPCLPREKITAFTLLAMIFVYSCAFNYLGGEAFANRMLFLALVAVSLPFVFALFRNIRADRLIGESYLYHSLPGTYIDSRRAHAYAA